jgi:hypothetical protein
MNNLNKTSQWSTVLDIVKTVGFFISLSLAIYAYIVREQTPWYWLVISIMLFITVVLLIWIYKLLKQNKKFEKQSDILTDKVKSQSYMRQQSDERATICDSEKESIIEDIKMLYQLGIVKSTEINDIVEKSSIMGEELGHHYTSVGCCVPREFYNYTDRMTVSKVEYKAMRWAANHLIPDDDLLDALRDGLCEICELAEYFRVVPDIVTIKLKLFEKNLSI